jgi:tRNA pseudouridine55 synthase
LIDKPKGWTSFDVVNYIRRMVANAEGKKPRNVKVGHTGTLDPLATGLLVILVGKEFTKLAESLSKQDKTYEVTMKLGEVSTTGDEEGEKSKVSSLKVESQRIDKALQECTGEIMQTPPAFSAMKVNGQRAYRMARQGKEVKLEPRPVTIYDIKLVSYDYPFAKFVCRVSSGTYVRSLVEDLGKALGTGAYMSDLRRTTIGDFSLNNAQKVEDLKNVHNLNFILLSS